MTSTNPHTMIRDENSGAVINTDLASLQRRRQQKTTLQENQSLKDRVALLEARVNNLYIIIEKIAGRDNLL